jgi:SAM-dependent methyltransferase
VRRIEARRRRLVVERVLRARPASVVDVGAEDGWVAEGWAGRVGRTTLVDVDPAMLALAGARGLPRTRTVVADARGPVPLPSASADVVVLSAVLEHLTDPSSALAAWSAALVPGGRFVVYVPADRPILLAKRVLRATRLGGLVRGLSLDPAPGHVRTFDRPALVRLLKPFGVLEDLVFDPAVLGYAAVVRSPRPRRGAS